MYERFAATRTSGTWYLDIPEDQHPYVEILSRPLPPHSYNWYFIYYGVLPGISQQLTYFYMKNQHGSPLARPFYYPFNFALTVLGISAFHHMRNYRTLQQNNYYKQYVLQHPELFPVKPRQKFKDMMSYWIPVR